MMTTTIQPNYENILRLFHEVTLGFQEAERRSKEIDRLFEETDRKMRETDRKMQETDRRMQETDRRMQETDLQMQETDRQIKETGVLIRETGLQMKESDRKMQEMDRKLSEKIGALGNRLGDFVQEMVRPTVVKLFQARGVDVCEVYPNISVERDGRGVEVDLFVVNGSQAIAIECKSRATTDDVKEHLERLSKFKEFFPRYGDVELMGAVAAMVMPDNVARYAYRRGLYVLAQSGEMVKVRNDAAFRPRFW